MRRWLSALAVVTVVLCLPTSAGAAAVLEKHVNLDESMRVASGLRARGLEVVLTRTSDVDVDLAARGRAGRGALLLLSIHNNGSSNPAKRGSEVYAQVGSSTSEALATRILDGMTARAGTAANGVFRRPGERGDYYAVLRNSPVPAVIVEGAYLTNPEEARLLSQPAFRQRLADGIVDGVIAHLAASAVRAGPGPPPSKQLLGVAVPSAPEGLTAARQGRGFRLSWSPVLAASGYEVWRDGALLGVTSTPRFDDGNVALGGHHYDVRAVLDLGTTRLVESPVVGIDVAAGRVVVDPGHGGADPGAVGTI